jgi:hypothetical protein
MCSPMVFFSELEIEKSDRDEGGDDDKEYKGNEEDPEEGVYLVTPDSREYVMQLYVDGGEGQEARHEHLRRRRPNVVIKA